MPTFEVDVRGKDASRVCEQLEESNIVVDLLPGGVAIGSVEADCAEDAEERIEAILKGGMDSVTVRPAAGRPQAAEEGAPAQEAPTGPGVA